MMRQYRWSFILIGWLFVIVPALALGLTLMPIVPAMQEWDSITFSYVVYQVQYLSIGIGIGLMLIGIINTWPSTRWWWRTLIVLLVVLAGGLHYLSRTEASAEEMFNEPSSVKRTQIDPSQASSDTTVYMWVYLNGQAAGYPLDLVAHHHKIHDTVGGVPVLVTYCTMCHTGRVYSPMIDGKHETFRLVGANHFNAIFEDRTTGSWWYQATGECVVGPLKGKVFSDIPFTQGTVSEMLALTNASSVSTFVPDEATGDRYDWSRGFAVRTGDTTQSYGKRSLVIGVEVNGATRAYPLRDLVMRSNVSVITDTVNATVIAFQRPTWFGSPVTVFRDSISSGVVVQSYREYWHSWKHFHPTTTTYQSQ
ncbi:MAG: DUF3179 domain-containing protein [Ignavibacteria bacterium]|nr:DUF3179 domain-containing protein [Ignavibacteria bacterium]MBK7185594.1 DUF3179 domain-containing protein [Ignavibacteria bacterium]MBK7577967.1 DUF3179 domain-containing protein [Ignavibacteria bacterium]